MHYRTLGASGLQVSTLCMGTMTFGDPVSKEEAFRLTHAAMDRGVNFIDTANIYEGYRRVLGSAGGLTEEIVGHALKGHRDRVVLATKVGSPNGPEAQERGLSASHVFRALEQSLQRLQTDYIDLYIPHWPDEETPVETLLATMEQARRQGKIRYFGVSNHAAWQICEMLYVADRHGWPRVVSSQLPYGLLRREFELDLEFCVRHNISVTPFWTLQGGLLTGKYTRGQAVPAGSRAAEKPEWMPGLDDALFDRLEAIERLAREANVPMAQYALAWTLGRKAITSLIVGVKRVEQLETALEALEVKIPQDHLEKIDAICPPPWRPFNPVRSS